MTPWIVAHQVLLSMGFPRQEYWSKLPFPSPGDLPDPGTNPQSPTSQADYLSLSHLGSLGEVARKHKILFISFGRGLLLNYSIWTESDTIVSTDGIFTIFFGGVFILLLPGKSHGRRGLVGCSPWGR